MDYVYINASYLINKFNKRLRNELNIIVPESEAIEFICFCGYFFFFFALVTNKR